ncbi:MAG: SDR family NAD(P)-dependent oxidoreductase [Myxococcota bacterium]
MAEARRSALDRARVGVVVGAGARAGVGGALCRKLAREGLAVVVAGRTPEKLAALGADVEAEGGRFEGVVADTTRSEDVKRIFDAADSLGGAPELTVYNAGNNRFAPLLEMDEAFFEGLWRLCAFGAFLVGQEVARRVVPAGGGTLVFTGATASLRARPPFTAFASAKAAERALAHGMAREFGPQGLHVAHAIIDGVIDGDQVNSRFPQLKEQRGDDGMLDPHAIADAYWQLHVQPRSAWSLEIDLRPYKESF